MNIRTDIKQCKKALISIAKINGIYENFGQKEVNRLRDSYIDSSSYSEEMHSRRRLLRDFSGWCMNFTKEI